MSLLKKLFGIKETPKADIGSIQVHVETFGIFSVKKAQPFAAPDRPTGYQNDIEHPFLIHKTDRIPLQKGLFFGVSVICKAQTSNQSVKLRRIIRFPPPGIKNPKTGKKFLFEEETMEFEIGKNIAVLYAFDHDYELLPGKWKFEVWDNNSILAEKTLEIGKFNLSAHKSGDLGNIPLRSSAHPAHALAHEAEALEGKKRVEMIDRALALSPQDADLLYAKACALDESFLKNGANQVMEQLAKLHPNYFDIAMKEKNFFKRPLPEDWLGGASFESWSEDSTKLEGLMQSRLDQSQHVQIVSHCLTPTIAMVYGADSERAELIKRMRWELRWAKTPYGNIAVHYLIIDLGNNETVSNEAFLPHSLSNPPFVRDSYCLLQRLAQSDHCFLVLADSSSNVLRNELFEFPESLQRTLIDVKNQLDKIGPCDPLASMNKTEKWYMDNTDTKSIKF